MSAKNPVSVGRHARTSQVTTVLIWFVVLLCLFAGSAVTAYAFHLGAVSASTSLMFGIFWVGMFLSLTPLAVIATRAGVSMATRVLALVGVAAVTTLPRILRSPSGPLFHDEYAHLRQTEDIISGGVPGSFNSIVTASPHFPGMHYVTAWISDITGLGAWQSGLVLISIAHIVGLVSVFVLVRTVGVSARGAAFGTLVYAANANWMYFHSQFSYESLGLPIALAILAFTVRAVLHWRRTRWMMLPFLALLGYVLATVHHLSYLGMLLILAAMAVSVTAIERRSETTAAVWGAFTALAIGLIVRLSGVGDLLLDYLGAPVTRGVTQLQNIIADAVNSSASESEPLTLFDNSILPGYERIAGFLVPVIFAGMVVALVAIWWGRRKSSTFPFAIQPGTSMRPGLILFGLLYFPSLPFMLVAAANEGGRRSWGYTMVGLAALAGVLVDALSSRWSSGRFPVWMSGLLGGALVVLLVGGVATGVNADYRFPLKQNGVSDLTAASPETRALGEWFAANVPPNTWVLADRYSTMAVAGIGAVNVAPASTAFPYWELYTSQTPLRVATVTQMYALNVQFLVVDRRMASVSPANGWWIGPSEPRASMDGFFTDEETLNRFEKFPWLTAVYGSENYIVYRIDLDLFNPYAGGMAGGVLS